MGFYLNYSNRLFLCALANLIPYSLPPQYLIMFSIQFSFLHLDWVWKNIHHHWGRRALC